MTPIYRWRYTPSYFMFLLLRTLGLMTIDGKRLTWDEFNDLRDQAGGG